MPGRPHAAQIQARVGWKPTSRTSNDLLGLRAPRPSKSTAVRSIESAYRALASIVWLTTQVRGLPVDDAALIQINPHNFFEPLANEEMAARVACVAAPWRDLALQILGEDIEHLGQFLK